GGHCRIEIEGVRGTAAEDRRLELGGVLVGRRGDDVDLVTGALLEEFDGPSVHVSLLGGATEHEGQHIWVGGIEVAASCGGARCCGHAGGGDESSSSHPDPICLVLENPREPVADSGYRSEERRVGKGRRALGGAAR